MIDSSGDFRKNGSVAITVVFLIVSAMRPALLIGDDGIEEVAITDSDREHWAYRPIARPAVPKIENDQWSRNPIDRFVLRRLSERGLTPSGRATSRVLARRLYLDLIGIPPSPEELDAIEHNPIDSAVESIVDYLLSSPRYGERWGQHWLDLARFAETDGFEHDRIRKDAWQYRDWVIDALNRDLPYDQFVKSQIAGDLIDGADPIATAFCLSGPDMPDINLQTERKHTLLNEMTATVGAALLGLQVGCAQCHNHMYDPISQADFYR
ncbi:MAG: DUF1549 domain-containing protein, partial [Planctomycetales bacterium]|nr:DUF1549 domain-containing protein [Planctomycetales bacterium]